MLLRVSLFFVTLLCLTGCYQGAMIDFAYKNPNLKTKYYSTLGSVSPDEIIVNKSVDLKKYKRLLVINITEPALSVEGGGGFYFSVALLNPQNKFWQKSLQAQGFFNHIVPMNQLANFLSDQGCNHLPTDMSNLQEIQKIYGNFLVIELSTAGYTATMSIIDPATSITYFKVKRTQLIVTGYSQQLYYPILNVFEDWIKKNS